ncbi:hypothetical protein BVY02_01400, partial [bacterium J17]
MQLSAERDPKEYFISPGLRAGIALVGLFIFLLSTVSSEAQINSAGREKLTPSELASQFALQYKKARLGGKEAYKLAELLTSYAGYSSDFPAVVENADYQIPDFRADLGRMLLSMTKKGLVEKPSSELEGYEMLSKIVLSEKSAFRVQILRLFFVCRKAERFQASGDAKSLIALRSELRNPTEYKIVEARIASTLESLALSSLNDGDEVEALRRFAEINSSVRSEEVYQGIASAVSEFRKKAQKEYAQYIKNWPLENQAVVDLIFDAETRNAAMTPDLIALFEIRIMMLLAQGREEQAERYFNWVLERRPDPAAENTALRKKIVFSTSANVSRTFVMARFEELKDKNQIAFAEKLQLLGRGYYGRSLPIVIFLAATSSMVVLLILLSRKGRDGRAEDSQVNQFEPVKKKRRGLFSRRPKRYEEM